MKTITLDDFVEEYKIVPSIMKVDIEGAEHLFLLGASNVLKKYNPIIYMETHSEFCAIRCYEILKNHNYSIEIINEEEDNRIMIKAVVKKTLNNFQNTVDSILKKVSELSLKTENNNFNKELLESLLEKEKENQQIREELKNANSELAKIQKDLYNMYNSKSWKFASKLVRIKALIIRKK